MSMPLYRLGNTLYQRCYPAYRPLYAAWKAVCDRRERALLRRLVRPGMTVVDVGANIGTYSRFLARLVGAQGHVYAFEPAPDNFARLQENVRRLQNVTVVHAAVGDTDDEISLYVSDELNVDHRTYDSGDNRRKICVPAVRLDDYFSPGREIALIKIDVQGYEYSVWQGAKRVFQENPDINIIMEYWPYGLAKAGVGPEALLGLISSMGFTAWETTNPDRRAFDGRGLGASGEKDYCNLLVTKRANIT